MGHYSFLKDLEESKVAVNIVKVFLKDYHKKDKHVEITELGKDRQKEGDVEVVLGCGTNYSVEVKYDMMAQKTGNLCFETHNSKGNLTGVCSTEADEIHYVVPSDTGFVLYVFETDVLKDYLFNVTNTPKFRSVKGGDRRATFMLLAPIEVIVEDDVPFMVETIDAKL